MVAVHEIIQRVHGHVIRNKKMLAGARAGEFKTNRLGSGYDFCQLRDYQSGDDVRFIDWKSSARAGKILLREWRDEQCRTLNLIIDVSDSMLYGTGSLRKYEVMMDLVAAILLMGNETGDSLGLHFLHDGLEKSILPRAGKKQVFHALQELVNFKSGNKLTRLGKSLEQFASRFPKRSLVFIVSDFIDDAYETALTLLAQRHEVIALRIQDAHESSILACCSAFSVHDSETAEKITLDSLHDVTYYQSYLQNLYRKQVSTLQQAGITIIDCNTAGNHIDILLENIRRYF